MASPEKKIRAGQVSATVWKNKTTDKKTGKENEIVTVSIERNYKDKEGNWKTTTSMNKNDLPKVVLAASKAYEYIMLEMKDSEEED